MHYTKRSSIDRPEIKNNLEILSSIKKDDVLIDPQDLSLDEVKEKLLTDLKGVIKPKVRSAPEDIDSPKINLTIEMTDFNEYATTRSKGGKAIYFRDFLKYGEEKIVIGDSHKTFYKIKINRESK